MDSYIHAGLVTAAYLQAKRRSRLQKLGKDPKRGCIQSRHTANAMKKKPAISSAADLLRAIGSDIRFGFFVIPPLRALPEGTTTPYWTVGGNAQSSEKCQNLLSLDQKRTKE